MPWCIYIEFIELRSHSLRTNANTLSASKGAWEKYLLNRIQDAAIMWVKISRKVRCVHFRRLSVLLVQYITAANTERCRIAMMEKIVEHFPRDIVVVQQGECKL